jgi:hypothetical protein
MAEDEDAARRRTHQAGDRADQRCMQRARPVGIDLREGLDRQRRACTVQITLASIRGEPFDAEGWSQDS